MDQPPLSQEPVQDVPFQVRLRRARESAGLTQEELAAGAGLTPNTISALERGEHRHPYPATVRALATALGLTAVEHKALRAAVPKRRSPRVAAELPNRSPPAPLNSLIGREDAVAAVTALLGRADVRLVTLTGPGGVGKTRLALQVASDLVGQLPERPVFVSLVAVRDPALVASTIARDIGIVGAIEGAWFDRLCDVLHDREVLLVLDNVEHLLAAAPLVTDLLQRCPRLTILATSRSPLRLAGEYDLPVLPLAVPNPKHLAIMADVAACPAVRLFVARAQATDPGFTLTEANFPSVAGICHRLDGLPLAIELAAARNNLFAPAALFPRLMRRLPLLTSGRRDGPDRHRTMRDAIAWSNELLSPDEQALFRRLGIFVGGFTLEAVAAVGGEQELVVLDRVAAIVDQQLVSRVDQGDGEPRFQMLETIREYALEQLTANREGSDVSARHAAYFRDFAARVRAAWISPDYARCLDQLDADRGNLRAAFTWAMAEGQAELALELAIETNRFWRARGPVGEGIDWLERALALQAPESVRLRAEALELAGDLAAVAGDLTRALVWTAEAEVLARDLADPMRLELVLSARGRAWFLAGEPARAVVCLEEALALAREHGWIASVATNVSNLGVAARMLGDTDRAVSLLEEGLALSEALGFAYNHAATVMTLADAVRDTGDVVRAETLYREGLRLGIEQREQRNVAVALAGCAALAADRGEAARAARLCGAADAINDRVGSQLTPGGRANYDAAVASAGVALGEARFKASWNHGRTLDPETAVADVPTLGEPDPAPTAPTNILSARELDVLRLVIEGRSNAEIARELFIGVRTARAHVTNILVKLGVPTRTAAATYAIRHGLI